MGNSPSCATSNIQENAPGFCGGAGLFWTLKDHIPNLPKADAHRARVFLKSRKMAPKDNRKLWKEILQLIDLVRASNRTFTSQWQTRP